jgi:hypothetical protein
MALTIPMPELSGDALLKGISTGGNLIHQMMLNKYYNTLHPSGDVANAMYVEQLRNQFGENDPRYIQAKRAYDLAIQGRQSLIDYRDVLNQLAGIRNTTTTGKELAESQGKGAQDILDRRNASRNQGSARTGGGDNSGYEYDQNGNNVMASPQEVNDILDKRAAAGGASTSSTTPTGNPRTPAEREVYMRKINKETGDADARKRERFAENIDITRKSIDPEDLTRYSGLKGTGNYLYEAGQSVLGNPSQEFVNHNNAVNAASLLAKQVRQFYGESIQAPAMKKLEALTNPSTWYKNPKIAQAQWDQFNKILDAETATYKKYGTSPIQLGGLDFQNGKFVVGKAADQATNGKQATNSGNEGGSFDLSKVIPQLMKINPNYTEKNIKQTAKENNMTVDDVVNRLFMKNAKKGAKK